MSQSKQEPKLREVAVKAMTVDVADELDRLDELDGLNELDEFLDGLAASDNNSGQVSPKSEQSMLDNIAKTLLDDGDDWFSEYDKAIAETANEKAISFEALLAERDRLHQELEALRSQHQFECEYVDQLEQEIISVTQDRDRQVEALTVQIDQLTAAKLTDSNNVSNSDINNFDATVLNERLEQQAELIQQLQCQNTALEISQQALIAELEATQKLLKDSTQSLELAQTKISEISAQKDQLEEELIQHLSNQAKLHQSLRGLETEYVGDLTRVQELEQQIEDLQNHVLAQASKTTEYEAAIQHWKEQSVRHQHHALQLSAALERLLAERPLKQIPPLQDSPLPLERSPELIAQPVPERSLRSSSKVDLPAFLVRNRNS